MTTTHELKIEPRWFEPIRIGHKNFEYRRFDRPYKKWDKLVLKEIIPGSQLFTGRELHCSVGIVLDHRAFELVPRGYCILSLMDIAEVGMPEPKATLNFHYKKTSAEGDYCGFCKNEEWPCK